jgi:hypothetical protein
MSNCHLVAGRRCVAVCVLTTAPVAIAMTRVSKGPTQDILYNFHKSLGVLILILMILCLINRLAVGALTAAPEIEPWQKTISSVVHTSHRVGPSFASSIFADEPGALKACGSATDEMAVGFLCGNRLSSLFGIAISGGG